jgi:cytochrome o ubiquinol oxidase operon protein cyoD
MQPTVRSYLTGFILALLLTIVPFALVAWGNFPSHITLIIIAVFGLIQVIVQFHYFLHIDFSRQKREDLQLQKLNATANAFGATIRPRHLVPT